MNRPFKVSGNDGPQPSSPQRLQVESNEPGQRESRRSRYSKFAGGAGLIGGISCTVSMTLLVLGLLGTVTAQASNSRESMAGMGATSEGPGLINLVLAFLIARGPIILVISIVLVALAVSLRQRWFAIPALAAGALMYWGMYVQSSATLMYFASGFGIAVWLLLFVASRRTAVS